MNFRHFGQIKNAGRLILIAFLAWFPLEALASDFLEVHGDIVIDSSFPSAQEKKVSSNLPESLRQDTETAEEAQAEKTPVIEKEGVQVAQTSEVTIMLEKKMPGKEGVGAEAVDESAGGPFTSDQKPETYEELEDPFAVEGEELPVLEDPFEGYNRFMFGVNEAIYDHFMEPVARGYKNVLNEDIRIAIGNVFDNALSPVKLVSSLVQGDIDKSGRVLGRVVVNTTLGIGGLFDVAKNYFELENVNEDFEQALGYHGVETGPYIVLPFFGPSTARNLVGRSVDAFLDPAFWFGAGFFVRAGLSLEDNLNDASFILEDKEALEESAVDEYESVRDFYHQYREGLIRE